ncbi:MAG: hypothetical protein CMJ84_06950 [Planctomycetes bacterium]|jgi:hypothetical protein|nr:hypothetical protein [Planctomycetota bacterium]MDP6408266.1 hypothetical protein [Planctomycetota bacterium]
MSVTAYFVAFLLLTVALLVSAVVTGMRAARRAHLSIVVSAVVAMGLTIYFAERVGETLDVGAAGWVTPVHLWIAKITTVAYLLPIASGVRALRGVGHRAAHRKLAFFVLGLTALTAVTGVAMVWLSEPGV